MMQNVDLEPAFNWWVKHVLRKRYQIVAKVQQHDAKKYAKIKIKFRIEGPKTVDQDLALDRKNSNTLWDDDISKEMNNIQVTFDIWEKGDPPPVGHQFIKCHKGFDVSGRRQGWFLAVT